MANKEGYRCGWCGTVHDSIEKRMNCEKNCFDKLAEEARRSAEAKKKAEKDTRQNEVDKAVAAANSLIEKFIKDYGSYEYTGKKTKDYFRELFYPFWF